MELVKKIKNTKPSYGWIFLAIWWLVAVGHRYYVLYTKIGGHLIFKLFYVGAHYEVTAVYDFRYGGVYFIFYGFILGLQI
jgi:hypothetical protein